MDATKQLINMIINQDLAKVAEMIRTSKDRGIYTALVRESINYYNAQVDILISLVNIDKYNNGDKVYPKENCLNNFYKDQEYILSKVSLEKQTAAIGDGSIVLTELDFDILDEHFYKKWEG